MLPVFIKCCSSDALDITPGKGRFKHIGSIERTGCPTGTDDGMDFVNKKDDTGSFGKFIQDGLHAFFKLSAVLRAGHDGSKIQRDNTFTKKYTGNFFLNDPERQALNNGRFTHTRFTDQDRIVLLTAAQNLGKPFDFFFTANDRVEPVFFSSFGKVNTKIIKYRGIGI